MHPRKSSDKLLAGGGVGGSDSRGGGVAAAPPRPHAESDGEVAPIVSEVEADAAVPEESLPLLHQLLDPLQGAAVTDTALCAWLLGLLHPIREV